MFKGAAAEVTVLLGGKRSFRIKKSMHREIVNNTKNFMLSLHCRRHVDMLLCFGFYTHITPIMYILPRLLTLETSLFFSMCAYTNDQIGYSGYLVSLRGLGIPAYFSPCEVGAGDQSSAKGSREKVHMALDERMHAAALDS